jgi:hypothetical protein
VAFDLSLPATGFSVADELLLDNQSGTEPGCVVTGGEKLGAGQWYNPGSWNWGHMLGSTWNGIRNNCAKGAVPGVVGTASGALIANLIVRGGAVFVGPQGVRSDRYRWLHRQFDLRLKVVIND